MPILITRTNSVYTLMWYFAEFMSIMLQPPSTFLFPHLIMHRLISFSSLFYLINLKVLLRCISSMKASPRITCLSTFPIFELLLPWFSVPCPSWVKCCLEQGPLIRLLTFKSPPVMGFVTLANFLISLSVEDDSYSISLTGLLQRLNNMIAIKGLALCLAQSDQWILTMVMPDGIKSCAPVADTGDALHFVSLAHLTLGSCCRCW